MTMPEFEDEVAVFHRLMRDDFQLFLRKAFSWVNGGAAMLWNWHFDAIAYELDQIACGANQRLLVTLPPRNGKSIAISVAWVAWMLGRDPARKFVCVSYSGELAAKLARDCLSVMQSAWYQRTFPGTVISKRRSAAADFETTCQGGRLSTSVGGTLTGRGGDIIILDDIIKPEEAFSETVREHVNEWFRSTLSSRLNDKASGAMICVMQRLHQYDPPGMLIEQGGWKELKVPAIAAEEQLVQLARGRVRRRKVGDILHPEREPLAVLEDLRQAMGSVAFAAQYLQDPVPAEGNIIAHDWLRFYDAGAASLTGGTIVQSWDTASKDNPHSDWSVCVTARIIGNAVYVIDVFRKRMKFPELKAKAIELARHYQISALLIEDASSGQQLLQTLWAEAPAGVPPPIPRKPEGDKVARAMGVSAMIEAGRLNLPETQPWLATFMSELLAFPNARHDDQVDALSQLLIWARRQDSVSNAIFSGPEVIDPADYVGDDTWWDDDIEDLGMTF